MYRNKIYYKQYVYCVKYNKMYKVIEIKIPFIHDFLEHDNDNVFT